MQIFVKAVSTYQLYISEVHISVLRPRCVFEPGGNRRVTMNRNIIVLLGLISIISKMYAISARENDE